MNKIKIIATAIAGVVMVGAFSPFSYWWLVFLCLAILYVSITGCAANSAFKLGLIFGLFFFGFGVPWTYNSIHEFGNAPVLMSAFLAGLLIVWSALFPATAAFIFAKLCNKNKFDAANALAFSAIWALCEWLRSWILTGFPWLLVGHVHHSTPLHGIIPVFGSYGASWLTLLLTCFLITIILGNIRQKILSFFSLLCIALVLLIINPITWTSPEGEELNVALVQGNIPQDMKFDQLNHPYIMEKYLSLSEKNFHADIIVWPETAIPTYYSVVKDNFIKKLNQVSAENNVEFLVGVFTYDHNSGKAFNSVMTLGQELSFYQKQHLVPFGEYMPLRGIVSLFEHYIDVPMSDLSEGEGRPLVRLKGYDVGASICYEAVFGNEIIQAMPEAKFLINVSNDAWFGDSLAPHQHLEITQSRALETGRYLLRATNTGISAIIDPNGVIIDRSVQFKENIVRANIRPYTGQTLYARWGNWAIVTILFSILFIISWYKLKLNQKR